MLDEICAVPHVSCSFGSHPEASFSDPTESERVIFLPGGKAMIVDWNMEAFVKGVVSFTIAGVILVGAGIYGLMWAEERVNKRHQQRGVAPRRPVAIADDSEHSGDDEIGAKSDSDN